jgi:hypothetical protein
VTITTGGGFAGTFPITAVPTPRTFQYQLPAAPTTNPNGGGSSTYFSPFRIRIDGNTSGVLGGSNLPYNDANLTAAVAGLSRRNCHGRGDDRLQHQLRGRRRRTERRARRPQLRRLLRLR